MDKPFFSQRPRKPKPVEHLLYPAGRRNAPERDPTEKKVRGPRMMRRRIAQLERSLYTEKKKYYKLGLRVWFFQRNLIASTTGKINSRAKVIAMALLLPRVEINKTRAQKYRRWNIISLYPQGCRIEYLKRWDEVAPLGWFSKSVDRGELRMVKAAGKEYYKLTTAAERELSEYKDMINTTWNKLDNYIRNGGQP